MSDDGIRETQGMACSKGADKPSAVVFWEGERSVFLKGCYEDRRLTVPQARYLAKQLVRLADRIDARLTPITIDWNRSEAKAKGGRARAAKLTPGRRREIAKKAAAARWGKAEQQ